MIRSRSGEGGGIMDMFTWEEMNPSELSRSCKKGFWELKNGKKTGRAVYIFSSNGEEIVITTTENEAG